MADPVQPESRGVIYGCPLSGFAYTEALYSAARELGMDVREAVWAGRSLLEQLRRGDTIHLHWPSFFYYSPAARWRSFVYLLRFVAIASLLRLRGVRIVWTAHNLYPHDGGKQEWMHRWSRRFLVAVTHRIFAHGPTAAKMVSAEFGVPASRISIIPHGHWVGMYPNTHSPEDARRRLGLPAGPTRVLLFFGQCKPYKGLETLIEAMPAMPADTLLLVAGRFPSREYEAAIKALAQRVAGPRVVIVPGFVDDAELQTFFNAADVVVLPYLEILTSGNAMLSMSFGRPVVAPRLGSLIDVIHSGCGELYDPDDPEGLTSALARAATHRYDSAAIMAHAATFTWEDAALALREAHAGVGAAPPGAARMSLPSER